MPEMTSSTIGAGPEPHTRSRPRRSAAHPPVLSPSVRRHLGTQLREALDAGAGALLPNRLADLLADLERALDASGRILEPALREELLAALPPLQAFAISLCRDRGRADDLVQETVARGLRYLDRFERGTNFQAWLFVILRNQFYSERRRSAREVEDPDEGNARRVATAPDQLDRLAVGDLRAALARIPAEQRDALLMVAVEGLTYEQTAEACGCVVGTIKSRVSRARERLAALLDVADGGDFGTDDVTRAVTG